MTNEEAIRILPDMKGAGSEWDKAINLAIDALKAQLTEKDTTSDTIYRQAAIDIVSGYAEQLNGYIGSPNDSEVYAYARGLILSIERNINAVRSVQPTYTDAAIQKMQDLHQAEIEKAFELGREDARSEVTHCGECKHKGTKNCVANVWATILGVMVKDDFYCGLAERRTDEGD